MESESTIQINQHEKRAIQYELFTANNALTPDAASVKIYKYDKTYTLEDERGCIVDYNKISILIEEPLTANTGTYELYWKIEKDNQIFYKTTRLEIDELPW